MKNHKLTTLLVIIMIIFSCKEEKNSHLSSVLDNSGFDNSNIDSTKNPCTDFDSFANGNWKKKNPLPATESRWGAFEILDRDNKVKLQNIIDSISRLPNLIPGSESQQIADFYRSYMDTVTIEKTGLSSLDKYFEQIDHIKNYTQWINVSAELEKLGVPTFISYKVEADSHNNRMNILYLGQGGLTLGDKSYYDLNEPKSAALKDKLIRHIDTMHKSTGFEGGSPGATIYELEQNIARLQLSSLMLRDQIKTYNKMPVEELSRVAPQFSWDVFLKAKGINTQTVVVEDRAYMSNLTTLLHKTPLATLKLYARWQLLSHFAPYLSQKYSNPHFAFFGTVMTGQKEQKGRRDMAIKESEKALGMPLGKLFVQKYFLKQDKQKISEMIENVRWVYHQRIDSLSWMSNSTKASAHHKLKEMTFKIGYPEKWPDYSGISIQPLRLIDNIISVAIFHHNENINKIDRPVDKNEWHATPQTVDAFYDQYTNSACFPAGILQPPFYNHKADDAINYGAIIAAIGHEITHAFDDRGSRFDASGNLSNWWTATDRRNFENLTKQYIDYFNRIEGQPGLHINGQLTISENIADLGGLTLAYHALKRSYDKKKQPAPINGFTWQQRFFLGWAQMWHGNISPEALRNELQTNPHVPFRFRINGPLAQLQEFKQAWNCYEKDSANLLNAKEIQIW
ncbi:endothelin-converting protein [Chryseobacterium sp. BLS98]|uniref:M13 family metallopeptidase n=1 Tax=Chryseobacterium sp. BLS98 TaxID=885586 RepID=UPI00065AE3BE|nr:M13 family metallopeptidase [Chryseobacterium sp. BLS98]KMQ59685.1 endothelin-converting protein [Chryseobacterium sp. BLS98]